MLFICPFRALMQATGESFLQLKSPLVGFLRYSNIDTLPCGALDALQFWERLATLDATQSAVLIASPEAVCLHRAALLVELRKGRFTHIGIDEVLIVANLQFQNLQGQNDFRRFSTEFGAVLRDDLRLKTCLLSGSGPPATIHWVAENFFPHRQIAILNVAVGAADLTADTQT